MIDEGAEQHLMSARMVEEDARRHESEGRQQRFQQAFCNRRLGDRGGHR